MSIDSSPGANPTGFTLFAVLCRSRSAPGADVSAESVAELETVESQHLPEGVVVRGLYDVSGMRGSAELMIWLHGEGPEDLQLALRSLRRTRMLRVLECEWSAMGVHREAEFNKRHVPGFLRGEHARAWLCLYPFDRSYEWYLLDESERSALLAEHGKKAAPYSDIVANTVATFALSDYEWLLPMESDNLLSLVDMMRALRATGARRHVRAEVPFYTGRRISVAELAEVLS